jgi:SSS family solute:Na+ symporter
MTAKVIIVLLYVLINIAIGYWASRRVRNVGDFFVAGRKVGPWVSAFAYGTTYFSAVVFVGYAGKLGWGFGLNTMWIVAGNVLVGSLLAWWVLARRTRTMTARLDALTMPEFLAARYNCPALRRITALVVFIFLVPYSASVYTGLGHLFEVNFGISFIHAQIFMALVTGIYLMLGGYLAVTLTDFFQGLVQIVGVALMVTFIAAPHGGLFSAVSLTSSSQFAPALGAPGPFPGWLTLLSLVIVTSVGAWGLPQMVQKFYSIRSVAVIRPAMLISTAFAIFIAGAAYLTGAMSHLYFEGPNGPGLLPAVPADPDVIVPTMLATPGIIPPWLVMLVVLVVLAASMSTLASLVLVSSAAVSVDLLGLRARGDQADNRGVLVMRLLCGVFIGLSVVLAVAKVTFIVNLMVISWGALAGVFLAPYIYGLYWKRATLPGAVAAMLTGLFVVALPLLWRFYDGTGDIISVARSPLIPMSGAAAMLVPLVVLPVVSWFTRPPAAEVVEHAFEDDSDDDETVAESL